MLIDDLREVRNREETYNKNIQVDDVIYMGRATIGKDEEEREVNVYQVIEGKTIKYYFDNDCVAYETLNVGKGEPGIIPSPEYLKEYEEGTPIKDIIVNLKQKQREEQAKNKDQEKEIVSLNELEKELEPKEKEEKEGAKSQTKDDKEKEKIKDILTGKIPEENIYQTIDVNKAKIDKWTTVGKGFDLPSQVKKIAVARPIKGDKNALSSGMTIYMLDNNGEIIDNIDGKSIADFFKVDDATGKNPITDNNIKHELAGHAERNIGQTMMRFKSTESTNLYLSIEQKTIGQYHEVYVGGKTLNGNRPVEIQLETDNVKIQTSSEPQEEADIMGRVEGIYFNDEKQKEADKHFEHGDDEKEIPIENVDGDEQTFALQCKYIPGTEMTWEQLSDETDKSVEELQKEFGEKLEERKEPEYILKEIEQEAEEERSETKEDGGRFREGPWSSARH